MKHSLILAIAALAAFPMTAQQSQPAVPQSAAATPTDPGKRIVAVVNGETITRDKFDQLWERAGAQLRAQYEKTGGKGAFLDNYIKKRLMIQEALKSGFDKRPTVAMEVEAAKEGAIFDRYVRDVVAESIVTDTAVRKYYDEHKEDFATPEMVKVRHIVVTAGTTGPNARSRERAIEMISQAARELLAVRPGDDSASSQRIFLSRFADAAARYSEDGTARQGGDLGWVQRGSLDPKFEEAAFNINKGVMSGVVESSFGFHLIYVEDKRAPGTEPFEQVASGVREFLMSQNGTEVVERVNRLTNELRGVSKISVFPENLN
jgi:parvulin-like peptidyl-prolyl isomerase